MKSSPANTLLQILMAEVARHAGAINAVPDLGSVTMVVNFRENGQPSNVLIRTEGRTVYRPALSSSD